MEPLITFAKENQAAMAVIVIVLIPLMIVYQKQSAPILFHTVEYILYFTVAHYLIYAAVQVIAWYKSQTPDINDIGAAPFNTPNNIVMQSLFDKANYNPTGLMYFELVVALVLLYIVVVVRPTAYSTGNSYKGDKERGMSAADSRAAKQRARYDRDKAAKQRSRKS